jgi:hypothetical protein
MRGRVYWDDEVPEVLHFRGNRRIGRIVGIADLGWAVMARGSNLGMLGVWLCADAGGWW